MDEKNLELEKKLNALKHDNALLAKDYAEAKETIKNLEDFHQNVKVKVEAASSVQNIDRLKEKLDQATKTLKERDDEILQLRIAHNTSKAVSVKLNTVLEHNKNKYEQDISLLLKEHRAEIKRWKKSLGNERKQKLKLAKQLEKVSINIENSFEEEQKQENDNLAEEETSTPRIICSICADPISNFKPKYFLGQPFNPTCSKCDDSFEDDNQTWK